MTQPAPLEGVLGAAVCVEDRRFGQVTGVVGDATFDRVIGLEVSSSADGRSRFLPWAAATLTDGMVSATSRLVLFDTGELESYLRRGASVARERAALIALMVSREGFVARQLRPGGVSDEVAAGTSSA